MRRFAFLLMMLVLAGGLAACGRKPMVKVDRGYNCVGMADDLKTLRVGDELPRVIQVLGMPEKAFRVSGWFGRSYDVLQYDVGDNPCSKAILHAREKGILPVVFDAKGQYAGAGDDVYESYRRKWFVSTEALVIDPVILNP